jgi:hypothetical protein
MFEPAAFIMTRKLLRGIKWRTERLSWRRLTWWLAKYDYGLLSQNSQMLCALGVIGPPAEFH